MKGARFFSFLSIEIFDKVGNLLLAKNVDKVNCFLSTAESVINITR